MPTKHPPILLALDPGLREMGYAVLAGPTLLTGGVLALRRLPSRQRPRAALRAVRRLLDAHRPTALVLERTNRHPVGSLHRLYLFTRACTRLAEERAITCHVYAPQTVRKSVVGDGWASKRHVAEIIAARFPALRVYLTQDKRWKERYWQNMFDAVALALHHRAVTGTHPPSRSRHVRLTGRSVRPCSPSPRSPRASKGLPRH